MVNVLRLLVGLSVGLSLWFVLSLGPPRRSDNTPVAWLLAAWAWVTIAFELLLLLALFHVRVPLWIAALVLAGQDAIFGWRLVLLYRTRLNSPAPKERTMQDTLWWRLVHLEPAVLRGAITGLVGLAGALGILLSPDLPDTILGVWVPLAAIVQALATRPAVTANARVVVETPDPINNPGTVVAGEAVTTATNKQILDAAATTPGGQR